MAKEFRVSSKNRYGVLLRLAFLLLVGFPQVHHAGLASEGLSIDDVQTPLDNPRLTNEVILLADSDSLRLRSLFPPGAIDPLADRRAEDVIVAGIESSNPEISGALLGPLTARYLISQDRLEEEIRERMPNDDPLEVLHRYVVLS